MGKKNKDKKKVKGAEKTQMKTDKKISNKMKKELHASGENDVEEILAEIEKEEKKRLKITEVTVEPPSRRLNFSFIPHPDKEQLILYGGEFFNGQKTFIYNDLFVYNISTNSWTTIKAPGAPPPRCGHQMVGTSTNKGQLWIFGGEFASPTQSQFYHYRDLWVFQLATKQWEKILAANGPSARSGHRMVYAKKHLFLFGGFHDNLRDYKYFNDIYSFNIETYKWTKLEPTGTAPAPRSGCCMVALNDGRILIYGGYSKERIKKDVDKGRIYTDSFLLTPEKNDTTFTKFKWVQTKMGGISFTPRCSTSIVVTPNNLSAYCFGGVFDTEDEENLAGKFFNDLFNLDLDKLIWRNVVLSGKKDKDVKSKRRKNDDGENADNTEIEEMAIEKIEEKVEQTTISDDGIFKVTVGPSSGSATTEISSNNETIKLFQPSARSNCGLAIKHGVLYLYGGMYEDGDKQISYNDFYSLDLKKLDEWKTILSDDTAKMEWLGSESEDNQSEDGDDDDDDDDADSEDDKEEEEEHESYMDTN